MVSHGSAHTQKYGRLSVKGVYAPVQNKISHGTMEIEPIWCEMLLAVYICELQLYFSMNGEPLGGAHTQKCERLSARGVYAPVQNKISHGTMEIPVGRLGFEVGKVNCLTETMSFQKVWLILVVFMDWIPTSQQNFMAYLLWL
jgi:hypothetical protein